MIPFESYYIIEESFNNALDVISNPSNAGNSFYDFIRRFEQAGGQVLGEGAFAKVLYHPSWPYVLKIFTRDAAFVKYARFVRDNPRKSFPKFYGLPKKVTLVSSGMEKYVLRMEQLTPLSYTQYELLSDAERILNIYHNYTSDTPKTASDIQNLIQKWTRIPNNIKIAAMDLRFLTDEFINKALIRGTRLGNDTHSGNFMQRPNGDIVITDPVVSPW